MRFCILAVPMDNSSLLKKINDRNQGTLMQTLGIEFTDIGEDYLVAERQQMAICYENGVQYIQKMISSSKPLLFNRKDKRGQGAC